MTQVTVHVKLEREDETSTMVPAVGSIEFAPLRRFDLGSSVVLPDRFTVELDDDGEATVLLEDTDDGTFCWVSRERVRAGGRRYVLVPASLTTLEYTDLVDVDPRSFTAVAPSVWSVALGVETAAREAADEVLQAQFDALDLEYATDAQVAAAVATEATNRASAVTAEASARAAADTTLTTNLTAETDRATAAEAAETLARTNADVTLGLAVTAETTARIADVDAEEAARIAADGAEATTRASADTANASAITSEATARASADTTEATARAAGDSTNASAISAETTRAQAAESANATAITTEATARAAGDSARMVGAAVSTDGSFSLPTPTGVGMEFVWVANALSDIRFNGTSG